MSQRPELHVMVGALRDAEGRVLIARRPSGKHMAGRWEFPGGKLNRGETPLAGLKRELTEELGVTLRAAVPLIRIRHEYPDRAVLLDVWDVTAYEGEPRPLVRQVLDWVSPDRLPACDLLEADRPIVTALRLPRVARLVSGTAALVVAALREDHPLAFLWRPTDADSVPEDDMRDAVRVARSRGHRVLVAAPSTDLAMKAALIGADGVLVEWRDQPMTVDPAGSFLVGAIAAGPERARRAAEAGANFVVVDAGEVPPQERLPELCRDIGVPAYVGWYPDAAELPRLRVAGAHGCATRHAGDRPAGVA